MNKARKAVVIAGVLALAASAHAANITLYNPAMVNGKQLAAGQYDLKVSPSGDVTFLHGKTEIATAKARVENRDSKARFNTVVTKANGDGPASITEIQLEGKKQALVFDNTAQASNER